MKVLSLMNELGLLQLIHEQTDILEHLTPDLNFTYQRRLVMGSGVYNSLYPNLHLQMIFWKLINKIFHPPTDP